MKAMRLFQSVAAALLQGFLSIRQNTFDGIEQHTKKLICIQLLHTRWTISSCQHSWLTSLSPQSGKVKQLKMKSVMKYFFLAGYVKYSHYITYNVMEMPSQC